MSDKAGASGLVGVNRMRRAACSQALAAAFAHGRTAMPQSFLNFSHALMDEVQGKWFRATVVLAVLLAVLALASEAWTGGRNQGANAATPEDLTVYGSFGNSP
jgi:hypothetical protein